MLLVCPKAKGINWLNKILFLTDVAVQLNFLVISYSYSFIISYLTVACSFNNTNLKAQKYLKICYFYLDKDTVT